MTVRDLLTVLEHAGLLVEDPPRATDTAWLDGHLADIAYDSRKVGPDGLFAALRGERADGRAFAAAAVAQGARAVLADAPAPEGLEASWIRVRDGRRALAHASDAFFGHPSGDLDVIGVTGTNGKTTTAYLIREMFEAAGRTCGLIGTVQYVVGRRGHDAARTTPEASDLQRMLRDMRQEGSVACVMEVSSHALALHRVDGTSFAAGVFTNLTRDHLDFHGDMDAYFAAKRRLFEMLPASAPAVINIDDRRGDVLARDCDRRITFAIDHPADVTPGPVSLSLQGLHFEARTPAGPLQIRSRLLGRFNLYNLLAAVATGVALDLPSDAIEQGLASLGSVPGRLEVVSTADDDVTVIVDYAHTDDALRNLLEAVRALSQSFVVTVFGCGGDRDTTKRPLMGAVAAQLSDRVVLTSDNPRSEEPERIIDDIEHGLLPSAERQRAGEREGWWPTGRRAVYTRVADRHAAIDAAIAGSAPGDIVVIAGKGHEKYQDIGGRVVPFDDVTVARSALSARRQAKAS